jgi:hypothetical protein
VPAPKVRLYVRPVLQDGTRPFLDPVYSANRKLKLGCAIHEGREQRFDSVSYYLRYLRDGKRVWEPLGSDASLALDALRKRQALLYAVAVGAIEDHAPEPESKRQSVSRVASKPKSDSDTAVEKHPLQASKDSYPAEVKDQKAPETHVAYREALERFVGVIHRDYMEDVTREDVLKYVKWERKRTPRARQIIGHVSCGRSSVTSASRSLWRIRTCRATRPKR